MEIIKQVGKIQVLPGILSLFCNKFQKFNNTGARMSDSIYHLMFKLFCIHVLM